MRRDTVPNSLVCRISSAGQLPDTSALFELTSDTGCRRIIGLSTRLQLIAHIRGRTRQLRRLPSLTLGFDRDQLEVLPSLESLITIDTFDEYNLMTFHACPVSVYFACIDGDTRCLFDCPFRNTVESPLVPNK